jgi:bifunctional DNA-binding transcriptional regulator/antitoxin component of YhaV-PrlF toxin-antitoxin module
MKKILEPTGDLCVKFTEEELQKLNIKEGDKFSWEIVDDGVLLKKYESIELDLSEFSREVLEMLIQESIKRNVSVEDVIEDVLIKHLENSNV